MAENRPGGAAATATADDEVLFDQKMVEQHVELAGEEELRSYRKMPALWYGIFMSATVIGTLLAINQNFNLHFLGIYVMIDSRYFYLMGAILLPLTFILIPFNAKAPVDRVPWYDVLFALLTFVCLCYFIFQADRILDEGWEYSAPWQCAVISGVLWLMFIEIGRRTGGNVIFWIIIVWSLFPVYTEYLPGVLEGVGQTLPDTASFHMTSAESFLGAPMQAFCMTIFGYLLFGAAMQYTGAGAFFINVAYALTGNLRGGPAKTGIFASGLFGSMSGSVVSCVLTTGAMTIPAMKKVGFPAKMAGAIEANASVGGAFMPPVMGTTAFVMASFLGTPYANVAIAATLPSLLFYVGLFVQVDSYAAKHGIHGIAKEQQPRLRDAMKEGWPYCISFAFLIYMLMVEQQETTSAYYATALLLIINQFNPKHRLDWEKFKKFIYGCGVLLVELCGVLAPLGMMVGALTVTGILGTLTNDLVFMAGNNTLVLLIMGAITSFILGLGLTSTACYIFLAVILAPALEKVGLDRMAVHMFLLYWGMVSFITPPVALAAFAGASLAKASPWDTGIEACKIGAVLYFVPFYFVYNPALMFSGHWFDIALYSATATVGVIIVGGALQDYLVGVGILGESALCWVGRLTIIAGGAFIAAPDGSFGLPLIALLGIAAAAVAVGIGLCKLGGGVLPKRA